MDEVINLHDYKWLSYQKIAGRCADNIQSVILNMLSNDNVNIKSFENIVIKYCNIYGEDEPCIPIFLGYKGYPSPLCISINDELVHGIPKDYILKVGDYISIDVGISYKGAIADCARTYIYGKEDDQLLKRCRKALIDAKKKVVIGNTLNDISKAIYDNRGSYDVISDYGGHGLDWNKIHASPFVSNVEIDYPMYIYDGLTLAIEPMYSVNGSDTIVMDDGWTVKCKGICCHYEDTVTVFNGECHSITGIWDENKI